MDTFEALILGPRDNQELSTVLKDRIGSLAHAQPGYTYEILKSMAGGNPGNDWPLPFWFIRIRPENENEADSSLIATRLMAWQRTGSAAKAILVWSATITPVLPTPAFDRAVLEVDDLVTDDKADSRVIVNALIEAVREDLARNPIEMGDHS